MQKARFTKRASRQTDLEDRFVSIGQFVDRRPVFSPRISALLRHGDIEGRYAEPFQIHMAIITAALQRDVGRASLEWALLDPKNLGGAYLQELRAEKGDRQARRSVGKALKRAREFVEARPAVGDRADARDLLSGLLHAADAQPWPGTTGTTDRVVFGALVAIALDAGSVTFSASVRQIAERSGRACRTVMAALARHIEAGRIRRTTTGRGPKASGWALTTGTRATKPTSPATGADRVATGAVLLAGLARCDAFSRGGLGASGARVLAALKANGGVTTGQAAAALGLHASTVRRRLRDLQRVGLARSVAGLWLAVEEDLDRVAEDVGRTGTAQRRRNGHARQRIAYRARLARLDPTVLIDPETGEVFAWHAEPPPVANSA
jgi:hypothetical protein